MKRTFAFFFFGLLFTTPIRANELDRFGKCYKQFAGEVVSPTHPLLVKVKSGSLTGANACKELLKSAYLYNGQMDDAKRDEGKKILHTFNILHNSFFSNMAKKREGAGRKAYEAHVYDYNDRSYYLLMALFSSKTDGSSNYPFNKIFSDPDTYKAVRESQNDNAYRFARLQNFGTAIYDGIRPYFLCGGSDPCPTLPFTYQLIHPTILSEAKIDISSGYLVGSSSRVRDNGMTLNIGGYGVNGSTNHNAMFTTHNWTWDIDEAVEVGDIVGIVPRPEKHLPHAQQRAFGNSDGYYRNYVGPALHLPYPAPIENIYDNLKAGILFTPNVQEAFGLDHDQVAVQNGVDKVPRQWVQDVIKDFLCREIPVIRHGDAVPYTTATRNDLAPFRNGVSCMRCHATIDSLAFISRNYQYSRTSVFGGLNMYVNQYHAPSKPAVAGLISTPDQFFPVRPADGDFRYRDYTGKYHNVALTSSLQDPKRSFRQFASYLSNMDDPYVCMTSKYFRYLTGIQPVFFDPGDPDAPALSARDKAIQTYIFSLGKELKAHADVKKTILDIVSSELFVDPEAENIKK